MDVTTGLSWAGYANEELRRVLEPLIAEFVNRKA